MIDTVTFVAKYQLSETQKEAQRARWRAYRARSVEKHRERSRIYRKDNAEALAEYNRAYKAERPTYQSEWRFNNAGRCRAYLAEYRARKLRATPIWADSAAIAFFYEEAARLSRETGVPHEVDHVLPLQGKLVCGLHVETNLRVVTREENRRKGRRFTA